MYKFHSLLFLLIIIFNNYKSIAQEDCSAIIRGYYFLKNKNEPVVNATVNLLNPIDSSIIKTTLTNDFGFFEFKNNCFGIYLLKANVINTDKNISQVEVKEKVKNLIIHIQKNLEELNEVVVTKIKNRNPGLKVELTSKLFEESKGQSLAQALSKLSGVSTLQTGSTISKPVIHGLHSSRILIFNNGVKLEGQQWGSDHAPEVDAFSAQKLSVSKGASNLIYGGDALGGVVIVELKICQKIKNFMVILVLFL